MREAATPNDVIIIGAGAAGLTAAGELIRKGAKPLLLEARQRLGGRIFTHRDSSSAPPIELGAEFIHGRPSPIFDIVNSAGLRVEEATDRRLLSENGSLKPLDNFWAIISEVDSQIPVNGDETYEEFLKSAKASPLHKRIAKSYVEAIPADFIRLGCVDSPRRCTIAS